MDYRRGTSSRRPAILDLPTFRVPKGDFTQHPLILQAGNASPQQEQINSDTTSTKYDPASKHPVNPSSWQPYSISIPINDTDLSLISPSSTYYNLSTSKRSNNFSNNLSSSQNPSILIKLPKPNIPISPRLPEPLRIKTPPHRRQPSPLPLSKIRALKNAYDALHSDNTHDYIMQIRLSRALSFNSHLQRSLKNMLTLSVLPFANEDDISDAQTSSLIRKPACGRRMNSRSAPSNLSRQNLLTTTKPQAQATKAKGTPFITRCGTKPGSGVPILVRWTTLQKDHFELYNEHEPMPRMIRYLLFEIWGTPFGDEGRDWEVDRDGRVWVRERMHRLNRWGRWWVLQASGLGRDG